MPTRLAYPILLVLLAAIAAGCSQSEPPSDTPAPGTVAATGPSPTETLDCDSVPFQDRAAVQAPLTNWRLAYGRMCPVLGGALTDCPQLIGAGEDDILRCLRQNIDADDDCPDAMRDALRDAVDGLETATRCRTLHAELVDAAIRDAAAEYGELPPRTVSGATDRCRRQNPFDAVEARGCVVLLLTVARVEREREEQRAAAREDQLAAIERAIDEATPALAPDLADSLRTRCLRGTDDAATAVHCAASAIAAHTAQHEALQALPADRRDHVVGHCLSAKFAPADRALGLANPDCITEDARAFAVLTADYTDEYPKCGPRRYRYSEMLDCARRRWLTHDRIVATKNKAVDEMTASIQPPFLRPAVAEHCRRGAKHASSLLRHDSFRPDEHATRIVHRDVSTCVDEEMSAYEVIARLAGATHAKTFESCAAAKNVNLHGWRMVAKCLHETTEDAGDEAFASALEPCLGAVNVRARYKYVEDLANCRGIPPR